MINIRNALLALLLLSLIACNNNRTKYLTQRINNADNSYFIKYTNRDSVNFATVYRYTANNRLTNIVHIKNDSLDGLNQEFDSTGNVIAEGYFQNGKKNGWFKYYYPNKKIKALREYIHYRDTSIGRINRVIEFNELGDTLKNNSFYYELYSTRDTINQNGKFTVIIKLTGRLFSKAQLALCNYDSSYRLLDTSCDVFEMKNFVVQFTPRSYDRSLKYIRGCIRNYDDGKMAELFFTTNFYVR